MRLKTLLLTTLAFAGLSTLSPGVSDRGFSFAPPAMAAVEVEIGIDQFYDGLDPYGDWVFYRGGYVFVPGDVPDRWRPYSEGRWVYTDEYGWLWVSDEPFGWATYHYGRWGYGDDLGWYWVPGRVWAPAWVSWRRGPDYVVWAPLPPTFGDSYYDDEGDNDYEVADEDIPENYWNAVPAARFLEANLSVFIYADDDEDYAYRKRRYIDETEDLGPVRYRNNMIVNNILGTDYIERETNHKVRRFKVKESNDYKYTGKRDGDEVYIFDRKVRSKPDAKPVKIKNVEEVEQVHGKQWKKAKFSNENGAAGQGKVLKKQQGLGAQDEQVGQGKKRVRQTDVDEQNGQNGKLTKKQKRQQLDSQSTEGKKKKQRKQEFSNENVDQQNSGVNNKQGKKKKRNQELSNESLGLMDQQESGSSNKSKKKKRSQDASNENSGTQDFSNQQQGKKKKRNQQNEEFSGGGKQKNRNAGVESDGQGQSGNNKKRKKGSCDPNSGECQ